MAEKFLHLEEYFVEMFTKIHWELFKRTIFDQKKWQPQNPHVTTLRNILLITLSAEKE